MRKIIIGFSKFKKKFPIFSWLIRLVDDKRFSHVYVKWIMKSGTSIIYQASGHAVNFIGNKRFETNNTIYQEFVFEMSDEKFQEFLDWAVDNSGAPYSPMLGVGICLSKLFNLKINVLASNDSFVCSKIAGYFFDKFVKDFYSDENKSDVLMPSDIYKLCLGVKNDIPQN